MFILNLFFIINVFSLSLNDNNECNKKNTNSTKKLLKEKPSKINFYKRKIREHYSKRFNLDSMISKTLNIYKKIHAHETPRD